MLSNGGGGLAKYTSMPQPQNVDSVISNRLIIDELNYDKQLLKDNNNEWKEMLTDEQRKIYNDQTVLRVNCFE